MLASRDIGEGELIVRENPLAIGVTGDSLSRQCRRCLGITDSTSSSAVRCDRCYAVLYCSRFCAGEDLIAHATSGECCLLQSHQAKHQLGTFLREALLALRLLYLKLTPAFTSNTDHLMHSNAVDRADKELHAAAAQLIAMAAGGSSADSCALHAAQEALCQVLTNAVEVVPTMPSQMQLAHGQKLSSVVVPAGIYRTLARTNHSCCNNASYHFKADGTVIMRAVALITEGSEITISYVRDKFALERCGPPGELEAKAGYPVGALCLSLHLRQVRGRCSPSSRLVSGRCCR